MARAARFGSVSEAEPSGLAFSRLLGPLYDYLADGMSVHLVGPPGSGRSEILSVVHAGLRDRGYAPTRIDGNASWRTEPFAVLLAAGIGADTPRRGLTEMASAVQRLLGASRAVLLCDDADDLDSHSIGALRNAHRNRPFLAVTTSRATRPQPPDALAGALAPAVELRVETVDVEAIQELAIRLLGAPLEAGLLSRVATKSGGLFGLARTLLQVARRSGRIALSRSGVWEGRGSLWSAELTAAVVPHIAQAGGPVWEAATVLATTGPLPVDEALRLLGKRQLRSMLASGLAHEADEAGVQLVGVFPPLLADYLNRDGSAIGKAIGREHLRSRSASPALGDILAAGGDLAASGTARSAGSAPSHAVYSHRVLQLSRDNQRARYAAWNADPTPENALPLVIALHSADAPAEQIRRVLSQTDRRRDCAALARLTLWHATWLAGDAGDLDGALEVIRRHGKAFPRYRALLDAGEAHVRFLYEGVPHELIERCLAARDERPPTGDGAEDAPETLARELLAVVRIEVAVASGATDAAERLLAEYRPASPAFRANVEMCACLVLIATGRVEEAIEQARAHLEVAWGSMHAGLIQAYGYVTMLGLTIAGRLEEASQLLAALASVTSVASFREIFNTGILSVGAEVAAWQGRASYARTLAVQARLSGPGHHGNGPYPGMVPAAARAAAARSAVGAVSSEGAAKELWKLVDLRLEQGYVLSAVFLAADAVELGTDAAVGARLQAAAASAQSPVVDAIAAYVCAANAEDPVAVQASMPALQQVGAQLHVVRAAVTCALLMRKQGRFVDSVELAEWAWTQSEVAGPQRSGLFVRLAEEVALSAREMQILGWLDSELSVAELSSALGLSGRTVETHVRNIANKIGVSGRNRLIEAAATWLLTPRE